MTYVVEYKTEYETKEIEFLLKDWAIEFRDKILEQKQDVWMATVYTKGGE